MKRLMPIVLAGFIASCAQTPMTPDTRSFDWLAGCWHMDRDNGGYDEMWLAPSPAGTIGVSREVDRGRVVGYELMRIELRPGPTVAYIAEPAGQAAAEFLLVDHEQGRLVFENPQHDFPSRIEYRYVDDNALLARIAGTRRGKAETVDYAMHRIDCEG
jgi:hypothetical protein